MTIGMSASTDGTCWLQWRRRLGPGACLVEWLAADSAQDPCDRDGEGQVDDEERAVRDRYALRTCDGIRGPHQPVDDPRLAADLGGDPARDQCDERQRPRRHHGPVEPGAVRRAPAPKQEEEVEGSQPGQEE